ncbi:hypothetical protein RHCRD62_110161 [Rhodococcus sp. RD6.2]|nr:hypothetical protein RHCRD62_110161 [Rhodococcus sp. RD6.2]
MRTIASSSPMVKLGAVAYSRIRVASTGVGVGNRFGRTESAQQLSEGVDVLARPASDAVGDLGLPAPVRALEHSRAGVGEGERVPVANRPDLRLHPVTVDARLDLSGHRRAVYPERVRDLRRPAPGVAFDVREDGMQSETRGGRVHSVARHQLPDQVHELLVHLRHGTTVLHIATISADNSNGYPG